LITQEAETGDGFSERLRIQEDTYVVLTDEDFESARVESSSTIKVDKFVDVASIDTIYFMPAIISLPTGKPVRTFTLCCGTPSPAPG
jgi:non-homologous end joining protein Ku